MPEEKKAGYVDRVRNEFITLAAGHGINEVGADELADFMIDKMEFSFRNGLKYARAKQMTVEERRVLA